MTGAEGGRVAGKAALVTGAGSIGPGWGNGKAAAVLYAREGAKVLCVDNRLAAAEETRDIVEREGGTAVAHEADVTDEGGIAAMVAACIDAFGRIDILHNNVGGSGPGAALMEVALDDWNDTLGRNVTGAFLAMKAAIPHMEEQGGGAIVNISSIAGLTHIGVPSTSYSAAKGALNELTKNIAIQYAARNIRANCVAPGLMKTPFILREKDGVRLSILYQTSTNSVRQGTQALIKQMWREIGVETELRNINASVFFGSDPASPDTYQKFYADIQMYTSTFDGTDPQAYMARWICDKIPGPENQWNGSNISRYCNPRFDELAAEFAETGGIERRAAIAKQMNDLLISDGALIPLIHRGEVAARALTLGGMRHNAWDATLWNVHEWHRVE